jgi:hypothetical protein
MYKQPNVPPMRPGDKLAGYLQSLVLFLRGFAFDVWKHDADKDQEIEALERRITALEGRM